MNGDRLTADQRRRAVRLVLVVDANLPKWRAWFPDEESSVEVPRANLLALTAAARAWLNLTDPEGEAVDNVDRLVAMMRERFEKGYAPCDSPPGFEERAYQRWKELGGKAKYLTAEEAARLSSGPPIAPVREDLVEYIVQAHLAAVRKAIERRCRRVLLSEVDRPRTPVTENERKAVRDKLAELGYRVTDTYMEW